MCGLRRGAAHLVLARVRDACLPRMRRSTQCSFPHLSSLDHEITDVALIGFHRSMGVHLTLVRSLTMDSWSEDLIARALAGGNAVFLSYISTLSIPESADKFVRYRVPRVLYYRYNLFWCIAGPVLYILPSPHS